MPDAVLLGAVEVRVAGQAGLDAGLHERLRHDVAGAALADRKGAAGAVPLRGAALVVLGLQEVGLQVGPAPAGHSPFVVVEVVAADVDHRVDRGRAAERTPAGKRDPAVQALVLGGGVVVPVDLGARELQVAEGDVDVLVDVRRPGLEQQHPHVGILAEAVGDHAPRRAGADNHVVVHPRSLPG